MNLALWHIGRDSHDRPVYEDAYGNLWKDTDPLADRPAKLYSSLHNAFDGDPDTPMIYMERYRDAEIRFVPKRDTW